MRNALPVKTRKIESAIINLDDKDAPGTHWVAYVKKYNTVLYFDSFGDILPPKELLNYLGKNLKIQYNYKREQNFSSVICGHLCLKFLELSSI